MNWVDFALEPNGSRFVKIQSSKLRQSMNVILYGLTTRLKTQFNRG